MKYILYCLLALFFFSCSKEKSLSLYRLEFPEPVEVTPKLVSDEILTKAPNQILVDSINLVFMNPKTGDAILFINKHTLETFSWGLMRNGPDDFNEPECARQDGRFWRIWDVNLRKVVDYEVSFRDSSARFAPVKRQRISTEQTNNVWITELRTMANGWSVGLVGMGNENMFVLLDEEMKIVKTFGSFPVEGLFSDAYMRVYGEFGSVGDKLYYASLPTGYIVCYDIGKEGEPVKEWEYLFTKPLYDPERGNWTRDNRDGFFDMKVTDEYIFLAFSGYAIKDGFHLAEHFFVLDHDGRWVKHIKLKDVQIGRFAIDGDSVYTWGEEKLHVFNWRELVE